MEVYADADAVELFVNDKLAGKSAAGEENRFKSEFDMIFEPGEIIAVAYTDVLETGQMTLHQVRKPGLCP
ncbi:hypothetical protein BK126_05175 [Paenibacillus sp. FSL H7-0326]|nr:hypothetical protein BK126_05175 [Paenibacillus sp. FSL H7-0326]